MLFNSLAFYLFLPLVFLLYWFALNRSLRLQNLFVVAVSYVFYGWWDWTFLLLIALTSFCSWLSGVWMGEKERETCPVTGLRGHRRFVMVANIVLNLGILGYFKYFNFFVESFVAAFQGFGLNLHIETLQIILPVGISFYTFQALSYSIDVYRGHIKPTPDVVAFFAYVSFFPQLVAGPIERATNLLPQFLAPRTFSYPQAVDGCRQMLWGFFKKMVVADNCAMFANKALEDPTQGLAVLSGIVLFAIQIYGDFSGYSDIAIGSSRLFGFKLMRNFAFPYFSRDMAEFWRRWHISLSTWFRDYLYIPLGGSRGSAWQRLRNILCIFLVSGFWHGANWTFVIWGLIHAMCFFPLVLLDRNRRHVADSVATDTCLPSIREVMQMAITFCMVTFAWVFFRAPTVGCAVDWLGRILRMSGGLDGLPRGLGLTACLFWALLLFTVEWVNRHRQHGLEWLPRRKFLRWAIYVSLAVCIAIFRGGEETFIYFQF